VLWDTEILELYEYGNIKITNFCCFQKCGIEKLVDELCAKLKEIQSEGKHTQYINFFG
jgi:hypothetical protein